MKRLNIILSVLIIAAAGLTFSCQQAIGASWYSRSSGSRGVQRNLTVKSVTIYGKTLYPEENGEDFIGSVNVPGLELYSDAIKALVVDSAGYTVNVSISIKAPSGQAKLREGEPVTVPIRLKDEQNPDTEIEKYLFLEQDSTINNGSNPDYNPKDPQGNNKFIIKITTVTEEVNPWEFYKEGEPDSRDKDNFNSNKFDEWVLNMPSMSGVIASYRFTEGSWEGSPESHPNEPSAIGDGIKKISNVKIYRYKTRKARWEKHGGFTPAEDPNDERFYFFRFTASSMGPSVDSSMFCVDRYSKFLFYYSEPDTIKTVLGNDVPSNWTDYAAPSGDKHIQFDKPFYKSDPVGYVNADGSVVLYKWIKDNINASNYHAQENPAYTKPAEKNKNRPGFSPYKNDRITFTKKTVTKAVNPKYGVSKPVILEQPADKYAKLHSEGIVFTVKTVPAPEGENLSYQWYRAENRTDPGIAVPDATQESYELSDTSAEIECYFYCIVKNTNPNNGKSEQITSERAKCHITDGKILTDAAVPEIIEEPKNHTLRLNNPEQITLKVKAITKDGGTLSYQWYKASSAVDEGIPEPNAETSSYTFTPDTASAATQYYYCIVTNTNESVTGQKAVVKQSRRAVIEIEEAYKVEFSVDGNDGGSLIALHNGKPINSGTYIKKGEQIKFVATPPRRYIVKEWVGVVPSASSTDKTQAVLKVDTKNTFVSISFEPKMTLTITPKIYNEDLKSWSTADGDHFSPKYLNGIYLAHNLVALVEGGSNETKSKNWEYSFPYHDKSWSSGGKGDYVENSDFIEVDKDKESNSALINIGYTSFSDLKIKLTDYLIKSNRHDYWRTEYVRYFLGVGPDLYRKQCLDNNSVFVLEYNEAEGKWVVNKNAVHINQIDANKDGVTDDVPQLPRPNDFNNMDPNYQTISFKGVTITYDKNFTLDDGEEKDFVITYKVDNHEGTRSKGTVKVIYTISWK